MDREPRTRWTDDRLDDLHTLVLANDERIDRNSDALTEIRSGQKQIQEDITTIMKTGDRRSDRQWSLKLAAVTVALSSVAALVIQLTHLH